MGHIAIKLLKPNICVLLRHEHLADDGFMTQQSTRINNRESYTLRVCFYKATTECRFFR